MTPNYAKTLRLLRSDSEVVRSHAAFAGADIIESLRAKIEELEGKIKKAGDILAEHQTMTAPTYLFNAIAALKQEGE